MESEMSSWLQNIICSALHCVLTKLSSAGAPWVAPLVKHLTLGFSSGHDLTVHEMEPHVGLWADSTDAAWDFLCSSPHSHMCMCSFSQNKHLFIIFKCLFLRRGAGDTESEAGSRLWAVSAELYVGLEHTNWHHLIWSQTLNWLSHPGAPK